MIKVIATDLDGTLFYPKKRLRLIPKKNKEFLTRFASDGGKVVVVSSRGFNFASKLEKKCPFNLDWIGNDGTFIKIGGKVIEESFFDSTKLKSLISYLRLHYDPGLILLSSKTRPIVMTMTRVNHITNFVYFLYEAFQGIYREPFVRSDHVFYNEIEKGETNKIMVLIGLTKKKKELAEVLTKELAEKFADFEFTWLNQFIEITPKGCSKASGVRKYLDYLGYSSQNVLVIGDSGNDAPMFDEFHENSYCMSHSPNSVKIRAKHVVDHVYDLEKVLYPLEDSSKTNKEGKNK